MSNERFERLRALFPDMDPMELYVMAMATVHVAKRAAERHGFDAVKQSLETQGGWDSLERGTKSLLLFWDSNLREEGA